MPNLPAHIDLAYQAAQSLRHPTLEANMGYFLLGSTTPDIRAMTRGTRERYHFTDLDFEDVGAGMRGLFGSHPELMALPKGHGPTQAFVAGYLTHLMADEAWIVGMYRPYFADRSLFEEGAVGNVMDRVLQLELDRQSWPTVNATLAHVTEATDGVDVGFIPPDTLADWRARVIDLMSQGFTWERLRFMARRISGGDESHPAHGLADEFIKAMPQSLDDLFERVPSRNLDEYRERAVGSLVGVLQGYLS